MATTLNFFLVARKRQGKKVDGRRHDSRRRPQKKFCRQKEGDKKKLKVVAVTHGDNPQFCFFDCLP